MNFADVTVNAFTDLWTRFIDFLPTLIVAILVIIIGWLVAVGLGLLIERLLKLLKVDDAIDKLGLDRVSKKVGFRLKVSAFLGGIVKWFLIIVFVLAAADILQLTQISGFLNEVLLYIPNIVVAVVILVAGYLLGNFVANLTKGSVRLAKLGTAGYAATISRWAIWIFAFLAALIQLRVAPELIQILFTGFIAMIAIAGGLAFGLGGKDWAQRLLGKVEREVDKPHDE